MRPVDLNMKGSVWEYEPANHKAAHHGHERVIYIGLHGQEVIHSTTETPRLPQQGISAFLRA